MFRATLCPSSGADDLVVFCRLWCSSKNTTKSSAPEDGHKVAQNMLRNLQRRNKYEYNTKWHLVGFLFNIELRCTVSHTSDYLLLTGPPPDKESLPPPPPPPPLPEGEYQPSFRKVVVFYNKPKSMEIIRYSIRNVSFKTRFFCQFWSILERCTLWSVMPVIWYGISMLVIHIFREMFIYNPLCFG